MKSDYRFYFALTVLLIFLMSLSSSSSQRMRSYAIKFFAPILGKMSAAVSFTSGLQQEATKLRLEKHLLEEKIAEMEILLKDFSKNDFTGFTPDTQAIENFIQNKVHSIPAKVIYRSPALWESILWVNVGAIDNEKIDHPVIAKNSPVVLGSSLIGVVEQVGRCQSMIRLITDHRLTSSVRVFRQENDEQFFLAKGEIHGSGNPFWRSKDHLLKGIGFNCDFADCESPMRDLRSINPLIIKKGDLLITTGLDGVFPKGLRVGTVNWIETLKEGDYFYTIEAEPDVKNFDQLTFVYILPPTRHEEIDE